MEFPKQLTNKIICSDALGVLKTFPDESIDCVVTSPPYYNLRDYDIKGQLGLEPTMFEYLDNLITIFKVVKRVLKKTGTVWINLGDTFGSSRAAPNQPKYQALYDNNALVQNGVTGFEQSLLGVPYRFALRMVDDLGFIWRNTIIWHKRNCMPLLCETAVYYRL